jgi:tRNA-binding EMAP/Myf-like protein
MRDLAYIAKIEKLEPIQDKDRIELATIAGWNVIVGKNEFKEGELVVYCEYDTVLPIKPEFEFLRKRCYSSLYNGFRIRNMKMAGVFSQGIVFPVSILPKDFKIKEGQVVAEILGIEKYDPEAKKELNSIQKKNNKVLKFFMKNKTFRKVWVKTHTKPKKEYPKTVAKSNETNIQKLFNEYKEKYNENLFYLTEKLEGQAATFLLKKGKYRFFSHNIEVTKAGNTNWKKTSNKYKIEKLLKKYKKKYKINLAIQGEIVGPGIQKNIYKLNDLDMFIYKIINVKTGEAFDFLSMKEITEELGLKIVPFIEIKTLENFNSIDEILEYSNGKSLLNNKVKREGIVWRSVKDQSIGFKAKSPEYLAWWSKNETTE